MSEAPWTATMALDELAEHRGARVSFEEQPVMLYRDGDRIWAIGARCTHQGAPLDRGIVKVGGSLVTVTCPAHGSMFNLESGAVVRGPAPAPVVSYEVRITDGTIEMRPR
jgi:nitrite reductase/ring-hydroxylating ferredoxin subunit